VDKNTPEHEVEWGGLTIFFRYTADRSTKKFFFLPLLGMAGLKFHGSKKSVHPKLWY